MLRMKHVLTAGVMALLFTSVATLASAQTAPAALYMPRVLVARPHILITPRSFPYRRRCIERLQLQYRPSGPVFYPLTYCWWVRG